MKTSKKENLIARARKVSEARRNAYRRYDLAMSMDAGVRSGVYLVHLMDPCDFAKDLYRIYTMRRISRRALWKFEYAEKWLMDQYNSLNETMAGQMIRNHDEQNQPHKDEFGIITTDLERLERAKR